jgi:hypothetical protein
MKMSKEFDEANKERKDRGKYIPKFSNELRPLRTVSQVTLERHELIDIKVNLLIEFLEEYYNDVNKFFNIVDDIKQFKLTNLLNTKDPKMLNDDTFNFNNIEDIKKYVQDYFSEWEEVDELSFVSINKNLNMLLTVANNNRDKTIDIDKVNEIIYNSIINTEVLSSYNDREVDGYEIKDRKINKTSFYLISTALMKYEDKLNKNEIKFGDSFLINLFYKFMTDNSNFIKDFIGAFDDSNSMFIDHLFSNKDKINFYSKYISKTLINKKFHARTKGRIKNNLISNLSNLMNEKTWAEDRQDIKIKINRNIILNLMENDYFDDEEKLELKKKIMEAKVKNS